MIDYGVKELFLKQNNYNSISNLWCHFVPRDSHNLTVFSSFLIGGVSYLKEFAGSKFFNPTALKMTKTLSSFGHSESKRDKTRVAPSRKKQKFFSEQVAFA